MAFPRNLGPVKSRVGRLRVFHPRPLRASPAAGKRAAPLVPPKPSLMAKPTAAPFSGSSPDPNRLAVLAQTSAQSSVESGPDTTTEGSVYRNAAQWRAVRTGRK